MSVLDVIRIEVDGLSEHFSDVRIVEANGFFNVVFSVYSLPRAYNKHETMLLIEVPQSYPNRKPDMFWVDEDVRLKNGSMPKSAEEIKALLPDGKIWRRFSWHLSKWDPAKDNLAMYLEFVDQRLAQGV